MTIVLAKLYQALVEAGASPEKAEAAAELAALTMPPVPVPAPERQLTNFDRFDHKRWWFPYLACVTCAVIGVAVGVFFTRF